MKRKMTSKWLFAIAIAFAPAVALAHPVESAFHPRPNLYHDRSPKLHLHTAVAHH